MGGPGPAEREQREVLRVVAAQVDLAFDGAGHVLVDDVADQRGGLLDADAHRVGDLLPDGSLGLVAVQRHPTAVVGLRVDVAEHHVGVGDGRLGTALVVAGRPGVRAGAARPDVELAAQIVVDPGDRPAAGPDRQGLEHRDGDHPAVDDRAELVVADAGVDDQADVEAGPAHVTGDHVLVAQRGRQVVRAHEPRDRTAVVGAAGGGLEHLTAAARVVDHQKAALVAERAQPVPHGRQFGLHRPLQVGIEHRGHGALVFA